MSVHVVREFRGQFFYEKNISRLMLEVILERDPENEEAQYWAQYMPKERFFEPGMSMPYESHNLEQLFLELREEKRNDPRWIHWGAFDEPEMAQQVVLYREAAQLDYGPAMAQLAYMLWEGDGVDRSPDEAMMWAIRAKEAGDVYGAYLVALFTEVSNRGQAHEYHEAAMRLGSCESARRLLCFATATGEQFRLFRLHSLWGSVFNLLEGFWVFWRVDLRNFASQLVNLKANEVALRRNGAETCVALLELYGEKQLRENLDDDQLWSSLRYEVNVRGERIPVSACVSCMDMGSQDSLHRSSKRNCGAHCPLGVRSAKRDGSIINGHHKKKKKKKEKENGSLSA